MKAIPEKLVSPFCKDTFLLTIDSITLLGSGKSRPSLIIFTTIKKGIKNKSRFIRKISMMGLVDGKLKVRLPIFSNNVALLIVK